LFTRIVSATFASIGCIRFINYGEAAKSELIFWVALAALPLIVEKEVIKRIYDDIDKRRSLRFEEMKKQTKNIQPKLDNMLSR
jgi:hypothetical protein